MMVGFNASLPQIRITLSKEPQLKNYPNCPIAAERSSESRQNLQ